MVSGIEYRVAEAADVCGLSCTKYPILDTLYLQATNQQPPTTMHDFMKLRVWNDAVELVTDVYKATEKFPKDERFGLTSQVRRCAVSMPSNIAEGAGRRTTGEFKLFLGIAIGSSCELHTQLIIANKLGFLESPTLSDLVKRIIGIQKGVYKLDESMPGKR